MALIKFREVLLDEEKGMYERYAALFALRNHGGDDAVSAIIDSLYSKSALLKHEVCLISSYLFSIFIDLICVMKMLIVTFGFW